MPTPEKRSRGLGFVFPTHRIVMIHARQPHPVRRFVVTARDDFVLGVWTRSSVLSVHFGGEGLSTCLLREGKLSSGWCSKIHLSESQLEGTSFGRGENITAEFHKRTPRVMERGKGSLLASGKARVSKLGQVEGPKKTNR